MQDASGIVVAIVIGSVCCLLFVGGIVYCIRTRNKASVAREEVLDDLRHDRI